MTPFLKQVAAFYYKRPDIQEYCFLFPNRRSMVFFKKYLSELVREGGSGIPLPVPRMYTVNDFFYKVSHASVTDRLHLLLELFQVYKELNPSAEPLDEFIFWGDVMLADFDDVDKYLADAPALLQNVTDFKSIQDSFDYLSATQKEAITHFLSHFRDSQSGDNVKSRFVKLWNLLYPVYRNFNARLREKGMAYEGMVYRDLAQRLKDGTPVRDILEAEFPDISRYAIIGLNALNECERLLLKKMRDAEMADFVWDYVSPEIQDKANKSSFFMRRNIEAFPQAFPIEAETSRPQEITVISVPSSVGQAKLAPQILSQVQGDPVETAFVLPDETLLMPLLNSLPPEQDSVNVTMGYPMSGSAVFTLLISLGRMQLRMIKKGEKWYFYHRTVSEVFSSGLLRQLLSEEEIAAVQQIKADAKYYIPVTDFARGPVLEKLFTPVITEPSVASAARNHLTEKYFSEVVALVGRRLTEKGDMLLELDFAKRCVEQLNILQGIDLEILPATHLRMLEQLLEGISVPFRGEPLKGLQVMGPLETRALDFRNLVILSANEGVFPRRSISSSFIPPELRKGFGLPTYEFQDAVWAYYFYRMIQRPEKIWLIWDSRSEGLRSGEESRYIKQLEYHYGRPLKRLVAASAMSDVKVEESIPKTAGDIAAIRSRELSASSLKSYLFCQAQFYYKAVKGLLSEEEVAESLDERMLGNVFHHVMQTLYSGRDMVTAEDLSAFLKDKATLKKLIRQSVMEEMHSIEVTGRNLVLEEVILDYVQATLKRDKELLGSCGSAGFRIIGLERKMTMQWEGFRFKGFADRMDSYKDGEVRIVDYKTGKVEDNEILITDDNAALVVEKLFGQSNKGRPKIALQLFLYDLLAHEDASLKGKRFVNSIYNTARLYTGPLPDVPESPEFSRLMKERLKEMLEEMVNPAIPFSRTKEEDTCKWCDFKTICGR